jgi:hypothetical protein
MSSTVCVTVAAVFSRGVCSIVSGSNFFRSDFDRGRGVVDELRAVEKFTRKGNEILYEVTVEDPEDSELKEVSARMRH